MTPAFSADQLRWFRLRRSGLDRPFDSPEAAASHLIGAQAQFLVAGALALWNRVPALDYSTFERLLYEERTLVKLWGQRHTLHLYASHEWPLIHGALAGQPTWWERRIARGDDEKRQEAERYQALLVACEALLREQQTLGRSDLRDSDLALDDWHLSAWGGLFAGLVRQGHAVHGAPDGGEGRFAHRLHWLPSLTWEPPSPMEANVTLARRYFASYGPATVQDFAYWRGAYMASARRWLAALDGALAEVSSDGATMLALRDDLDALHETPPEREAWPVHLLYRFDPLLLALRDKSWIVDAAQRGKVWRPAGHIEGTILEHGRIVGTWRYDRRGSGLSITLSPFVPLPDHARAAIEQRAHGVADFFGLTLIDISSQ